MKKENAKNLPHHKDRHLDVPAEANRDRHHNYLADEENVNEDTDDSKLTDRQKQWRQGLQEGREKRESD